MFWLPFIVLTVALVFWFIYVAITAAFWLLYVAFALIAIVALGITAWMCS